MKKELTPRKRQALEMRAKIQSTALSLFNQEGFENVSVEEIAQKTGLPRREVSAALESVVEPLSLEEPVYADGGDTIFSKARMSWPSR